MPLLFLSEAIAGPLLQPRGRAKWKSEKEHGEHSGSRRHLSLRHILLYPSPVSILLTVICHPMIIVKFSCCRGVTYGVACLLKNKVARIIVSVFLRCFGNGIGVLEYFLKFISRDSFTKHFYLRLHICWLWRGNIFSSNIRGVCYEEE